MENQRDMDLVRQVLAYERDRVRYLLKSYLRARLDKIQEYAGMLLATCTPCGLRPWGLGFWLHL